MDEAKAERLYLKAINIRENGDLGLWLPIIEHLALRKHSDAMIELASWLSAGGTISDLGRAGDWSSAASLYRRAFQQGNVRAAQHLGMHYFNRNDLANYRVWTRNAARAGDALAKIELRYFETRLAHRDARKVRRLRPHLKRDEFG